MTSYLTSDNEPAEQQTLNPLNLPLSGEEVQEKQEQKEEAQNENPDGIPILSPIREIKDFLKSCDIQTAREVDSRLKVWNTQIKYTLNELSQALAFANNQRRMAEITEWLRLFISNASTVKIKRRRVLPYFLQTYTSECIISARYSVKKSNKTSC